jgi:serine/threonine-protein kinase RsbW/sigma-B regulation protein RsbU (phosphoserine phosphatase)
VERVDARCLSVPGTSQGVQQALDALAALTAAHGISKAVSWPVEVSLDEVMANVVGHALEGRGEAATVDLELRLDLGVEPPLCEMMVVDDGPEFDPLSVPEPDRALGIEERPIGGLGMTLVRRLMDEVEYERRDGRNRLRLRRRLVAISA